MEAPNRPKDGLLSPARVDRSGRRATTPHATGGSGWPEVSVQGGGGRGLCIAGAQHGIGHGAVWDCAGAYQGIVLGCRAGLRRGVERGCTWLLW